MFLREVLEQYVDPASVVLDMCAAPGGKSTLLSQYLGEEGLLVSNEVVRQRVFILSENIQKWGNGNTVVTHNKAEHFGERTENLFDCILVDAPCSGEGMFRKDAVAVEDWSLHAVEMCAARQREILQGVWPALRPGGILIYSTCTYNMQEDDDNALWIASELGADVLPVDLEPEWGVVKVKAGYHFYPHKLRGEGFYLCALRKRGPEAAPFRIRQEKKKAEKPCEFLSVVKTWVRHPERWTFRQQERFIDAYPAAYKDLIEYLSSHLTCISTGFGVGEIRGKIVAPQHSLSMLKDFRKEAFPCVELSRELALSYLRTEALNLPSDTPYTGAANLRGVVGLPLGPLVLTYQGVPLGFVKNVGNRQNNLYPNEWRIRQL